MSEGLLTAARERTQRCRQAVLHAIAAMEQAGDRITLKGVATRAGVSRNFIYTTPEIHEALRKATERQGPLNLPLRLASAPSSVHSLRSRLVAALDENRRLRDELEALKRTNERLVGEIVSLQNPVSPKVTPMRRRRG